MWLPELEKMMRPVLDMLSVRGPMGVQGRHPEAGHVGLELKSWLEKEHGSHQHASRKMSSWCGRTESQPSKARGSPTGRSYEGGRRAGQVGGTQ